MLNATSGATLEQMMKLTGWQAHTVRGAISGVLRKRLGLNVVCDAADSEVRRYRIVASTYQRGQMGDYTLRADVWVRRPLVVARLDLPARAEGNLSDSDARRPDGQWVKAFRFNAKAADEIEARLTAQFDAYLILLSPTGETVA